MKSSFVVGVVGLVAGCFLVGSAQPASASTLSKREVLNASSEQGGDLLSANPTPTATDPLDVPELVGTPSVPEDRHTLHQLTSGSVQKPAISVSTISGFITSSDSVVSVGVGERPYESSSITPVGGFGTVDVNGVRMFKFAGQTSLWNHPVGQSQYALANLNSYRLTGDKRYLQIAERNAQRLIDRRFVSDTAWFYPYDFDFTLFGDTTQTLRAPWYSAMAQGQALSAFVRLYQVTGTVSWLDAAHATFQSLLVTPADSAPFASRVDEKGHLWFEEYPRYPVNTSEQVLNGHIFALFGLHDYWSLTQNTDAHLLYLGGLKTVEDTVLTEFRRPNWASVYSLGHKIPTLSYHFIHTDQFLQLWKQTRQPFFIQAASTFRSDYPRKRLTGRVIITSNVRTLWKVNSRGIMTSSRSVVFSRVSGAPWNFRQRIKGGAVGLLISKGPYQGWYVQEKVGVAWSLGAIDVHRYGPAATLQFSPRRFTAYRLGTNGKIVSSKQVSILRVSNAPTSMSAIVQGRPAWYVSKGSLAGYWVPMQSGVSLVS